MPWMETSPMFERVRFIETYQTGLYDVTELCARFAVSRKTGYKWIHRFDEAGRRGLADRSRAPHHCPHRMSVTVADLLCTARTKHPDWGPEKLIAWLTPRHPAIAWPAESTVSALLARKGLVHHPRRPKRPQQHPGFVAPVAAAPNELWTADFKGEFKTLDGRYCFPLTIADQYARYLLTCKGLLSTRGLPVRQGFERAFAEYGLPCAIRTDNGVPFASLGLHGLSQLNVWWMRLGIQHQRTRRASPQDNGVHERMHRTLKRAACRPARAHCAAQQRAFNVFRTEFNEERPHAALKNRTPASCYHNSPRSYTGVLPSQEYPAHYLVRKISTVGVFKFENRQIFLASALRHHHVGLEEVDTGIWNIYFNDVLLAKFDERDDSIRG